MAITNYSELQAAIDGWIDHTLFTAKSPDFITLFEAAANRRLRVRQQEAVATMTISAVSGTGTMPSDYLSWRRVVHSGDLLTELEYVEPSFHALRYPEQPSGIPRIFTIEGEAMTVRPIPDTGSVFLKYFAKIPALTASATTNWLLTAHPDVYLFGALVEAEMFGSNDDRAPVWKARRDEIFEEIEKLSNKTRAPGVIKVIGPTP